MSGVITVAETEALHLGVHRGGGQDDGQLISGRAAVGSLPQCEGYLEVPQGPTMHQFSSLNCQMSP